MFKLLLPFFLLLNGLAAQEKPAYDKASAGKGVTPVHTPHSAIATPHSTYAVVVGISDYQDPAIPDLRFADKDAEAFANFLRSPAGGSLDGDHLKLLTNAEATAGQVGAELYWLLDEVKEGDQAIIYFSGHGDVERKTVSQPGYLLCWDAPSQVYLGGGALALPMFQDIISTLSIQNKARVIVITDACRSGKLAGSKVGGAQITGANLAQKVANEIKILSCQPDEYSIEGEQWGGGRGAFSYHLIDGLYGMADGDANGVINLLEIGRYLEDHVSIEVAPHKQLPMTEGNRTEQIAAVVPEILAQVREGKRGQLQQFSSTDSRGIEDEVLAGLDTSVRKLYRLFKQALKDKIFLEPVGACADAYYKRLIQEPKLARLHNTMTRNYAAALQDEVQQEMNKMLSSDFKVISASKVTQNLKYKFYPLYLGRAAELLGENHYMYPILQARKLYFETGLMINHSNANNADRELGEKVLAKYRKALEWQPGSAHVYSSMSFVHFHLMLEPDSAEYYAHKAVAAAPSWLYPYTALGAFYNDWTALRNLDKVRHFLELAGQVDTSAAKSNLLLMNNWASYYNATGQKAEAERQFKWILELDSTARYAHNGLGVLYLQTGRLAESEVHFKKSIELDSTDWVTFVNLSILYRQSGRYAEAEVSVKKAHQLDPANLWAPMELACVYILTGRYEEAEEKFGEVIAKDSMFTAGYVNVGMAYRDVNRYEEAEQYFKRAIQLDPNTANFHNELGRIYSAILRFADAEEQFRKSISLDSLHPFSYTHLGLVYAKTGRYVEAEQMLEKGLQVDPFFAKNIFVNYAILYSLQGLTDKSFVSLEQAFQEGYKKDDTHIDIMEDPGLAPMRAQTERWEALLQKHFPDQPKD